MEEVPPEREGYSISASTIPPERGLSFSNRKGSEVREGYEFCPLVVASHPATARRTSSTIFAILPLCNHLGTNTMLGKTVHTIQKRQISNYLYKVAKGMMPKISGKKATLTFISNWF